MLTNCEQDESGKGHCSQRHAVQYAMKWFRPFKYQTEFFETGAHPPVGMIAANRAGKTIASTYETAYHLTGRYPKNWKGKSGTNPSLPWPQVNLGSKLPNTATVKLLGCDDIKQSYKLGTGSIPREKIDDQIHSSGWGKRPVYRNLASAVVKSKLYFSNYTQQVRHLQGFELDLVVLDEQPPDEMFSELVVRTAASNGQVICSFTPLKGCQDLVRKFWDNIDGYTHVRVTWDDVPFENEWGEDFFSAKRTGSVIPRLYALGAGLPYERYSVGRQRCGVPNP
jgi:phage terminase large subunit-like protein